MKRANLSDKDVLAKIENYAEENDHYIRHRQLQQHFGVGTSKINNALNRLRKEGSVLPSTGQAGIRPAVFISRQELQVRLKNQMEMCKGLATRLKFQKDYNKSLLLIIDDLTAKLQVAEEITAAASGWNCDHSSKISEPGIWVCTDCGQWVTE